MVTVTREGMTSTYQTDPMEAAAGGGCRDGIIEPGDEVTVELYRSGTEADFDDIVGAGAGWGCQHR